MSPRASVVGSWILLFVFSGSAFIAGRMTARPTYPDTPSELVQTPDGGKVVYTPGGDVEDSKQPWCFAVRKITFDTKTEDGETGTGSMVFAQACEELSLRWLKEGK